MTPIREILAAATPIEGGFRAEIPSDWLQGRTAYGGLSRSRSMPRKTPSPTCHRCDRPKCRS